MVASIQQLNEATPMAQTPVLPVDPQILPILRNRVMANSRSWVHPLSWFDAEDIAGTICHDLVRRKDKPGPSGEVARLYLAHPRLPSLKRMIRRRTSDYLRKQASQRALDHAFYTDYAESVEGLFEATIPLEQRIEARLTIQEIMQKEGLISGAGLSEREQRLVIAAMVEHEDFNPYVLWDALDGDSDGDPELSSFGTGVEVYAAACRGVGAVDEEPADKEVPSMAQNKRRHADAQALSSGRKKLRKVFRGSLLAWLLIASIAAAAVTVFPRLAAASHIKREVSMEAPAADTVASHIKMDQPHDEQPV